MNATRFRYLQLHKILRLIFLGLIAAGMLSACGGGASRPIFLCGLEDRNGDGEINFDDGWTAIYSLTVNKGDISTQSISDPEFDHRRVLVAPSGEKILYLSIRKDVNGDGEITPFDDGQGLYVADPDGQKEDELIYLESDSFSNILWSRDSTRIAYLTNENSNIWTIYDVDGRRKNEIEMQDFFEEEGDDFTLAISPDGTQRIWPDLEGRFIVADRALDREEALGEPVLTDRLEDYYVIGWSPDSQRLLLTAREEDMVPPDQVGLPPSTLYIINADGSGLKRITDQGAVGVLSGFEAAWSPDGEQVAYLSVWDDEDGDGLMERGDIRLMLVNSDGTGERVLITDQLRLSSCLSW